MDTSILRTEFLANLAEVSPSVAACFTSTATLPTTISPTEASFAITEALLLTQEEYNDTRSSPPYLSVVTSRFDGNPIIFDGNYIRSRKRKINYHEVLGPVDVNSPTSAERIII